jgi:superfamily II DNA/RNA helicase
MADALQIELAKLEQLIKNPAFTRDTLEVLEDYKLARLKLVTSSGMDDDKLLQRLSFAAALLEYLGVSLLNNREDNQVNQGQIEKTFRTAAELFEYTYTVSKHSDRLTRQELAWALHAALCYTLGGTAPNSQFIATKIGEQELQEVAIASPYELYAEIDRLSILFLARKVPIVNQRARNLLGLRDDIERLAIKKLDSDEWGAIDVAYLVGYLHILQALNDASEYLLEGAEAKVVSVSDELASAERLFFEIHAAEEYRSVRLLRLAINRILEASIWKRLTAFKRIPKQLEYLERLARRPLIELWKSQIDALDAGVLDLAKNRIAISMPTSSGKTLVAEMAIIQMLTSGQPCVYVVPTRALTAEVRDTLQEDIGPLGYRIASVVGTIEWHEVESEIIREADVLVVTPEKLDLLIRRKDPKVMQAGLVIFDEGHNIEDKERGLRLELAVINVKQALPQAKILLLSAVLPNAQQIANWLANGVGTAITVDWRPTRLKPGYFTWDGMIGEVRYHDKTKVQVFQKRIKTDPRFSTLRKTTAQLAKQYANLGGVLVLTTSKPECEAIAKSILDVLDESEVGCYADVPEIAKLALQIQREIGKDFLLGELAKSGIAYHHADLPPRVRRSLEKAIKGGSFRYIVSTTTLAEGVNLPISTVIVHDLKFKDFDDRGRFTGLIPMSRRKFWNIAGRAGRALRDTEGHVILLEPDSRWPELDLEEYLNWHLVNLEPVESILKKIFRKILRIAQDLSFETSRLLFSDEPLIEQFQVEILHAILEGYLDPSQPHTIRQFVNQTLFAYQTDRETREYRRFVDFTRAHVRHVAGRELLDRQFQEYIDTSGLSINSSIKLYKKLVGLGINGLARLVKLRDSNGQLDDQILGDIFDIVFTLREMRPRDATKQKAVLLSWICGKPLSEIARLHFEDSKRPLEQCSNFIYSQLTNLAPWGLYAFQQMIEYIRQYGCERLTGAHPTMSSLVSELLYNEELSFLPLYANFGVDDPVAAYLCLLGVERIDSLILTKRYRETDSTLIPYLNDVKGWLISEARTFREWFKKAKRPFDEYLFQICQEVQRELNGTASG